MIVRKLKNHVVVVNLKENEEIKLKKIIFKIFVKKIYLFKNNFLLHKKILIKVMKLILKKQFIEEELLIFKNNSKKDKKVKDRQKIQNLLLL